MGIFHYLKRQQPILRDTAAYCFLLLFALVTTGQTQSLGDLDQDNDGLLNWTEGYQLSLDSSQSGIDTYWLVVEEISAENTDPVTGIKNNRAGFRHNLNPAVLSNYFPLLQQRDADQDGVADHGDLDSDNDGIADVIESGLTSSDGDGLVDDALTDRIQVLPDFFDIDSDEDGLFDLTEVGGLDQDNNGLVDTFTDSNGDGWEDSYLNAVCIVTDLNNNGQADQTDPLVQQQVPLQNDAALAQAGSGTQLHTGLRGSGGCVFNPLALSGDSGVLLLLLSSFLAIGIRFFKGRMYRV